MPPSRLRPWRILPARPCARVAVVPGPAPRAARPTRPRLAQPCGFRAAPGGRRALAVRGAGGEYGALVTTTRSGGSIGRSGPEGKSVSGATRTSARGFTSRRQTPCVMRGASSNPRRSGCPGVASCSRRRDALRMGRSTRPAKLTPNRSARPKSFRAAPHSSCNEVANVATDPPPGPRRRAAARTALGHPFAGEARLDQRVISPSRPAPLKIRFPIGQTAPGSSAARRSCYAASFSASSSDLPWSTKRVKRTNRESSWRISGSRK